MSDHRFIDDAIDRSAETPEDRARLSDLVPTDDYGRAYGRSAAAIVNIVYLDPNAGSSGGFYPDGLNGDIVYGTGQQQA